eukprot:tig00000553_g2094.t1
MPGALTSPAAESGGAAQPLPCSLAAQEDGFTSIATAPAIVARVIHFVARVNKLQCIQLRLVSRAFREAVDADAAGWTKLCVTNAACVGPAFLRRLAGLAGPRLEAAALVLGSCPVPDLCAALAACPRLKTLLLPGELRGLSYAAGGRPPRFEAGAGDFGDLATALAGLSELAALDVSGTAARAVGAHALLAASAASLPHLTSLSLANCGIVAGTDPSGSDPFYRALLRHPTLTALDVSGNTLYGFAPALAALVEAGRLRRIAAARVTGLRSEAVPVSAAGRLGAALRGASALEALDLSANAMGDGVVSALAAALCDGGCRPLRTLRLAGTWCARRGPRLEPALAAPRLLAALCSGLATNAALTALDLSCNDLRSVAPIAAAVRGHPALATLDLSRNGKLEDVAGLCGALAGGAPALRALLLGGNVDTGHCGMGEALRPPDLEPLAGLLAGALPPLTALDVSNSRLYNLGPLAAALAARPAGPLETLLCDNPTKVGPEAARRAARPGEVFLGVPGPADPFPLAVSRSQDFFTGSDKRFTARPTTAAAHRAPAPAAPEADEPARAAAAPSLLRTLSDGPASKPARARRAALGPLADLRAPGERQVGAGAGRPGRPGPSQNPGRARPPGGRLEALAEAEELPEAEGRRTRGVRRRGVGGGALRVRRRALRVGFGPPSASPPPLLRPPSAPRRPRLGPLLGPSSAPPSPAMRPPWRPASRPSRPPPRRSRPGPPLHAGPRSAPRSPRLAPAPRARHRCPSGPPPPLPRLRPANPPAPAATPAPNPRRRARPLGALAPALASDDGLPPALSHWLAPALPGAGPRRGPPPTGSPRLRPVGPAATRRRGPPPPPPRPRRHGARGRLHRCRPRPRYPGAPAALRAPRCRRPRPALPPGGAARALALAVPLAHAAASDTSSPGHSHSPASGPPGGRRARVFAPAPAPAPRRGAAMRPASPGRPAPGTPATPSTPPGRRRRARGRTGATRPAAPPPWPAAPLAPPSPPPPPQQQQRQPPPSLLRARHAAERPLDAVDAPAPLQMPADDAGSPAGAGTPSPKLADPNSPSAAGSPSRSLRRLARPPPVSRSGSGGPPRRPARRPPRLGQPALAGRAPPSPPSPEPAPLQLTPPAAALGAVAAALGSTRLHGTRHDPLLEHPLHGSVEALRSGCRGTGTGTGPRDGPAFPTPTPRPTGTRRAGRAPPGMRQGRRRSLSPDEEAREVAPSSRRPSIAPPTSCPTGPGPGPGPGPATRQCDPPRPPRPAVLSFARWLSRRFRARGRRAHALHAHRHLREAAAAAAELEEAAGHGHGQGKGPPAPKRRGSTQG